MPSAESNSKFPSSHLHSIVFLKTKAHAILKTLPEIEKIVYNQCSNESKNIFDLAKCLVALFNVRDRIFEEKRRKLRAVSHNAPPLYSTTDRFKNIAQLRRIRDFYSKLYDFLNDLNLVSDYSNRFKVFFNDIDDLPKNATISQEFNRLRSHLRTSRSPKPPNIRKKEEQNIYILSPKLFSFVQKDQRSKTSHNLKQQKSAFKILSPTLFMLEEDESDAERSSNGSSMSEGIITIPSQWIMMASSERYHSLKWVDFLIGISGLSEAMSKTLEVMNPISERLDSKLMPMVEKLKERSKKWIDATEKFTNEQLEFYRKSGYSYLNGKQVELLQFRDRKSDTDTQCNEEPGYFSSIEALDEEIEQDIRRFAKAKPDNIFRDCRQERRSRRQANSGFFGIPFSFSTVNVLQPFAFVPQQNSFQLNTLYVLSPQAFIPSSLNPTAYYAQILTPWAFIANYLSPAFFSIVVLSPVVFEANLLSSQTFVAEVLTPTTFQANLFNPNIFNPLILSPQTLIVDAFSPVIFQPRVLTPQTLLAALLSPNIASPNIYSNQTLIIDVLSPQILSPNIFSNISNNIAILSPDLLGSIDLYELGLLGQEHLPPYGDNMQGNNVNEGSLVRTSSSNGDIGSKWNNAFRRLSLKIHERLTNPPKEIKTLG
ncbi:moulting cycle domain-containing protein [Ditylenchus destructor]|nr:moulting cycle domain-containing protein [Ditylenchus destructor]